MTWPAPCQAPRGRHANRLGLPIGVVEERIPVLLHGPVGTELLRREYYLADSGVYRAVYWHTTAHPSLDKLGKLVFLADKLDPHKLKRYPYQPHLQELAQQDLDRAILEFLTREIISLADQGELIHPMMLETRNHLLSLNRPKIVSPM